MGDSSPVPKSKYTKPSIKEAGQPIRLPKLSPEMFTIADQDAKSASANGSFPNPWTVDETRLLPLSFESWPDDALSDNFAFPSIYQNLYIHRIDRPKFTKSLANLSGMKMELERGFNLTFGWNPPAELLLWMVSEAARTEARCPSVPWGNWEVSLRLCSMDTETIQNRSFFSWTKGDSILADPLGLLTGLFSFAQRFDGEKLLVSSLPSTVNATVFHTDHSVSYLRRTSSGSIVEFMLSEAGKSYHHILDNHVIERLYKNNPGRPATKAALASQLLFARTRWLVALLTNGELPEALETMLLDAPDWNLWQEEKQWLGQFPFLANYWHIAHWFFGNEGACREAISIARKAAGSVTARLADIVGRLLDGARLDLASLSADRIDGVRKKIQASLRPDMLGPLAKAAMKRKSVLLARATGQNFSPDNQHEHPLPKKQLLDKIKMEITRNKRLDDLSPSNPTALNFKSRNGWDLKNLLEKSTKDDTARIVHAVVNLTANPLDLGVCWGHAMKAAGDQGLTSFAPLAMRYCKTLVEDQQWDCHTDEARCYCVAESARTAALLIPDKANQYLSNLLQNVRQQYPLPRFIAIGSLLLAGLLMLKPHDKKNTSLLKQALYNRAFPRSAYIYGALRAIQATCNLGKTVDISLDEITVHIPERVEGINPPSNVCDAAQSALDSLFGRQRTFSKLSKPGKNTSVNDIGKWLREELGQSRFLLHPLNQPHHWNGLIALAAHGKAGVDELWKFVDLKNIHQDWMGPVIAISRRVTPISLMFEKFHHADLESIKRLLYSPTPESIGWLDFIAAWASLDASPTSLAAVSSACNWRYNKRPTETEFEEMLHLRLPLVLASFGKRSLVHFEKLLEKDMDEFNRTVLKDAVESLRDWEVDGKPSVCTAEQLLSGVTLEYVSHFHSLSSVLNLHLMDEKKPGLEITLKENHRLLDDGIYPAEYSYNMTFQDMNELSSFVKEFARVATILKYNCTE